MNTKKTLFIILLILLAIISFFIYRYYTSFGNDFFPSTRADWGQFGDYFGGTLNPILGFASFLALLATIVYQAKGLKLSSEELRLSTEELRNSANALAAQNKAIELQNFEQTFFSWLNTYRSILSSLEDNAGYQESTLSGRRQLNAWWQENLSIGHLHRAIGNSKEGDSLYLPKSVVIKARALIPEISNIRSFLLETANDFRQDIPRLIFDKWQKLYKDEEFQLDSLFRILFRLLVWIDSQEESRLSQSQKWLYISIIRSQLSWIEMAYFYINGLTEVGRKFKPIAEKYALFDNLTFDSDISLEILKIYLIEPIGYMPEAYSSEIAREKIGLPKQSEATLALASASPQLT